jgi:hypothetical protein
MNSDDVAERSRVNLSQASISELFALYGGILRELRERRIVRTANAPTGDYAEYLVAAALGGELVPNSEKGRDVLAQGRRIQVKSRVIALPGNVGQRQLSSFRSFDFDDLVIVLFASDYSVWKAVLLPADVARERSTYRANVNAHVLFATDLLLAGPSAEDLTKRLHAVTQAERPILASPESVSPEKRS